MEVKAPHTDFSQTTFPNLSPNIFHIHNPPNLARALFPFVSNGACKTLFPPIAISEMSSWLSNPNHSRYLVLKHPMKLPLTTSGPFIVSLQVMSSKSYRVPIELTMCTKNSFSSLVYYLTVCVLQSSK